MCARSGHQTATVIASGLCSPCSSDTHLRGAAAALPSPWPSGARTLQQDPNPQDGGQPAAEEDDGGDDEADDGQPAGTAAAAGAATTSPSPSPNPGGSASGRRLREDVSEQFFDSDPNDPRKDPDTGMSSGKDEAAGEPGGPSDRVVVGGEDGVEDDDGGDDGGDDK